MQGAILVGYGQGAGANRAGIDIQTTPGTPVVAAGDGTVIYAGNEVRGMGNLVLISHADGYITAYGQNQQLLARKGEAVRRGQSIAVAGPQLHFEVRHRGPPIDPLTVLAAKAASPPPPIAPAPPVVPPRAQDLRPSPPPTIETTAPDAVTMAIQTLLTVLGYDVGPADGFMGPKTTRAISEFQQRSGLPADGRPTEALRTRLQAAVAGPRPLASPPTPAPPVTTYDDTEGQLRVRQAFNSVALASRELETARSALEAERRRVVQTNEERDLNREMIQTLQRNVAAAEANLRAQETVLRKAQERRRAGLAAGK